MERKNAIIIFFFFNGDLAVWGRKRLTLKYIHIKGGKVRLLHPSILIIQ